MGNRNGKYYLSSTDLFQQKAGRGGRTCSNMIFHVCSTKQFLKSTNNITKNKLIQLNLIEIVYFQLINNINIKDNIFSINKYVTIKKAFYYLEELNIIDNCSLTDFGESLSYFGVSIKESIVLFSTIGMIKQYKLNWEYL